MFWTPSHGRSEGAMSPHVPGLAPCLVGGGLGVPRRNTFPGLLSAQEEVRCRRVAGDA
jgi:hypothetical protein